MQGHMLLYIVGNLAMKKVNKVPKDPWEGSQWKHAFEGKSIDAYWDDDDDDDLEWDENKVEEK